MHFDYLERELFTALARGNLALPGRKLRLWSAGCSTGCEPYTMAMVAYDSLCERSDWDVQILATDLSNKAVRAARAGVYREDEIKTLPKDLLERHFERQGNQWVVRQHLRKMVKIAQLNLMGPWPMTGPFDVIFCRNVMIYFDGPTRVSNDPNATLVTYALGSCIAVTVFDPVTHVGGMLHLMLPQSSQSPEKAKTNPCMFADLGIPMLFKSAYELGAKKERLVVCAAGGAEILADGGHFKIGSRNRTMLRKLFWKNSILLAAEDTGGSQSRTMTLRLSDGYAS
ncbi:Probable chemoreceptor glutamine deamidase CheD 1, partial [Durusdinium trenchii]